MGKFIDRIEKIQGVKKAEYDSINLHLKICTNDNQKEMVKIKVGTEINKVGLSRSVEKITYYTGDCPLGLRRRK